MIFNVPLSKILDEVPCGIGLYEVGDTPKTLYLNKAFFELIGYTREEFAAVSNRPNESFLHPDDRWINADNIQKLHAHGRVENCEYRVIRPDGTLRWVQLNLSRIEMDGAMVDFASFNDITSVKEAELALDNEQMTLQLAMQTAKISSWEYDVPTKSIRQAKVSQLLHGYGTLIENVPESLIEDGFVHPSSIEDYRRLFRTVTAMEGLQQCDVCVRTPDRKSWWWERVMITPVFDQNGRHIRSVGTTVDITEQKVIEARYDQQINIFNSANSPDLIGKGLYNLTQNTVEYYHETTKNALKLANIHSFDDGLWGTAALFVHADEADRFVALFDRYHLQQELKNGNTEASYEYQRKTCDGRIVWAETAAKLYYEPTSGDTMCFIYSYDIDGRKTTQEMIDTVVQVDYDYMALLDCRTQTSTVYANKQNTKTPLPPLHSSDYEREVAAYAHAYLLPEDVEQNIHDMSIANIRNQLDKQSAFAIYASVREHDGGISRKKLQFTYLDQAHEKVLITRIDITDIFEREQEQLKMLREANRAKTDFLSHMSHDLRTPMNAIIGLSELAQDELHDADAMKAYVDNIKSAGEFLLGLVNDCLDFEKLAAHKMRLHPVPYAYQDFRDGITTMIAPLCQKKNIEFSFKEAAPYTVFVDKIRLEQIFFNLLSNAVKYTPEGGCIQFIVDSRLSHDERCVICDFHVRDNGVGMSEDFQRRLFEPFEQESADEISIKQGTGLGLAIVKELVSLMGGTLQLHSNRGEGTDVMVHLEFPNVTDPIRVPHAVQFVKSRQRFAGQNVLLLEDQPLNMLIAKKLLENQGMTVVSAENGKLGLDLFAASGDGFFSAILTDVRMPVMNGLETARAIRALDRLDAKTVPIIAMTANAFEEDVQKSSQAGMNAHLSKPINPQLLYQTLEQWIFMDR